MSAADRKVIRFQLEVLFGIRVKVCERRTERVSTGGSRLFGVPLEALPRSFRPEFGLVPCFLVEASSFLLQRSSTVGLFRKPGSLPRIRTLRAQLNRGEGALPAAAPYDVAALIKQFLRELPEPLFPSELQGALLQAQKLPAAPERTAALQLLSCLLPARCASCLHFLFHFLSQVAQRCSENLMTSSNLAMVFAPCLLPPPDKSEMTEERLELRIHVLRTFIDKPDLFGMIPKAVKDSLEYLSVHYPEALSGGTKRRSFRVLRSAKAVSWIQGRSKVTTPAAEPERPPGSSEGPRLRRSPGLETFPNVRLFRTCHPDSGLQSGSSPAESDSCSERPKRDEVFSRLFSRGKPPDWLFPAGGKLPGWRRISL